MVVVCVVCLLMWMVVVCVVCLQGITRETLASYTSPHVDVISMGSMTQGDE